MTISKINISDNKHDAVILLPSPFDVPVFPTPKLSFSPWLAWLRPVLLPARTFQLQKHICLLLSGIEIPLVLLQPKLCSCAVCALQKLTLVALAPRLAGPQTASPSPPLVPGRYPHNLRQRDWLIQERVERGKEEEDSDRYKEDKKRVWN